MLAAMWALTVLGAVLMSDSGFSWIYHLADSSESPVGEADREAALAALADSAENQWIYCTYEEGEDDGESV